MKLYLTFWFCVFSQNYVLNYARAIVYTEALWQFHIILVVLREKPVLTQTFDYYHCLQELQAQLAQRADQYHRLLDQGESMLLARGGDESGPGTTQTQQNLSILQNKWGSLNAKMDDRRVKMWHTCSFSYYRIYNLGITATAASGRLFCI